MLPARKRGSWCPAQACTSSSREVGASQVRSPALMHSGLYRRGAGRGGLRLGAKTHGAHAAPSAVHGGVAGAPASQVSLNQKQRGFLCRTARSSAVQRGMRPNARTAACSVRSERRSACDARRDSPGNSTSGAPAIAEAAQLYGERAGRTPLPSPSGGEPVPGSRSARQPVGAAPPLASGVCRPRSSMSAPAAKLCAHPGGQKGPGSGGHGVVAGRQERGHRALVPNPTS